MSVVTFRDMERYRCCPYAYRMDLQNGRRTITAEECMDMSVYDAILYADNRRTMLGSVDRDDVMSVFWDS